MAHEPRPYAPSPAAPVESQPPPPPPESPDVTAQLGRLWRRRRGLALHRRRRGGCVGAGLVRHA
ncbi:MAG TPA: hypothetical protein VHF25_02125, partial [Nitriliruptorales bacterium]|nr:hypothetical protein [Nitriliruptorales bacterium]